MQPLLLLRLQHGPRIWSTFPRCRGAQNRTSRQPSILLANAGYASIASKRGATVHGVLWKITAVHIAKLDEYKSVAAGLYRHAVIPVHHQEKLLRALAYVASDPRPGRPKPGYEEGVIAAARARQLPEDYVRELEVFLRA